MQHKILSVFHTGILKNWEGECSNIPDVTLGFFSKQPIKFFYHLGKNNLVKGIAREERGFLDAFHPFASSIFLKKTDIPLINKNKTIWYATGLQPNAGKLLVKDSNPIGESERTS